MSAILIILVSLYALLGVGGLMAFLSAARRTSEDWEQHSAGRRMEAEEQNLHDSKQSAADRRRTTTDERRTTNDHRATTIVG